MKTGNTVHMAGYTDMKHRSLSAKLTDVEQEKLDLYLRKRDIKKSRFVREALLEKLAREEKA
jgi:hypothetical protein